MEIICDAPIMKITDSLITFERVLAGGSTSGWRRRRDGNQRFDLILADMCLLFQETITSPVNIWNRIFKEIFFVNVGPLLYNDQFDLYRI